MADAPTTDAPPVVISASIAYDFIMAFGGSFADHIIPEKTHVISVSFLVDSLRKQRGGVGGNIAYSLALLGTPSALVGAVGSDFGPYRAAFDDLGIDLSGVVEDVSRLTASAFMMADRKDNQIASFFPGPSDLAAGIDVTRFGDRARYGIVGATAPEAMIRHAAQFGASSCRLIYDPAFQIIVLSGDDIKAGIDQAWAVIGNDYEFAMIERKTGLSIDAIADRVDLVAITYGEQGSELRAGGRRVRTPAAPAELVRDPTGAGDAYRSGLVKGLLLGLELELVGRLAGLAATYVVEQVGTQEHVYTPAAFVARFDRSFPDCAGALTVADLAPSSKLVVRSS
ncbi:MAG TPA: PfkB family carbohydrate kinase [Thermomicrobiales bacterium]